MPAFRPVPAFRLACLAYLSVALPASTLGLLWPLIRGGFQLPVAALGVLLALGTAATVIASAVSGHLLSRLTAGPLLAAGTALTALALTAEAFIPSVWLFACGMMCFGLDKAKDAELELHYLFHEKIKALDVGVMEAILDAVDEYRDEDAHLIAAFKDDHLASLIREQYTLLAQLEDDVANGTVDIAWFSSQLDAVKQKQAELGALVSPS